MEHAFVTSCNVRGLCGKEDCEYSMLLLRTCDLLVKGSINVLRNNTLFEVVIEC